MALIGQFVAFGVQFISRRFIDLQFTSPAYINHRPFLQRAAWPGKPAWIFINLVNRYETRLCCRVFVQPPPFCPACAVTESAVFRNKPLVYGVR